MKEAIHSGGKLAIGEVYWLKGISAGIRDNDSTRRYFV